MPCCLKRLRTAFPLEGSMAGTHRHLIDSLTKLGHFRIQDLSWPLATSMF